MAARRSHNVRANSAPTRATAPRYLPRAEVIDAATRLIVRAGRDRLLWSALARELQTSALALQRRWGSNISALVAECHARSTDALATALLSAETAHGAGLDRLGAFLRAAFAIKRARGAVLPLWQPPQGSPAERRRRRERALMIRTRLERLVERALRDGSIAASNRTVIAELLLAVLSAPPSQPPGPAPAARDVETTALLLRALAADSEGARAAERPPLSAAPGRATRAP